MLPQVNYTNRTLEGSGIDFFSGFQKLYEAITGGDWQSFVNTLGHWWDIYSIFAILLSLLFFAGYIYASIRYGELYEKEQEALHEAEHRWAERYGDEKHSKNTRWGEIETYIISDDPKAWKIALIEADILLEQALTNAGYVGATIGDKLKTAQKSSFTTLQDAWEAHKVRNQIAHEGGDFILTKRIAQETVKRYERVFREFGAI